MSIIFLCWTRKAALSDSPVDCRNRRGFSAEKRVQQGSQDHTIRCGLFLFPGKPVNMDGQWEITGTVEWDYVSGKGIGIHYEGEMINGHGGAKAC